MNKAERCGYLDLVKLIAIVSVCLYHFPLIRPAQYSAAMSAGTLISRYFRGMNSVCVPLFMMVNGALLLGRPFECRRHLARTLRLFVGVYLWYLITQIAGHLALHGPAYVLRELGGIVRSALYLL